MYTVALCSDDNNFVLLMTTILFWWQHSFVSQTSLKISSMHTHLNTKLLNFSRLISIVFKKTSACSNLYMYYFLKNPPVQICTCTTLFRLLVNIYICLWGYDFDGMSFFSHKIKCRKCQTCNQTGGPKYWDCISHQTHHHLHCIVALVRGKRGGVGGGGGEG